MPNKYKSLGSFINAFRTGMLKEGDIAYLRFSNIDFQGAKSISDILKSGHCPTSLKIDLNSNIIESEGTKYLSEALASGHCPKNLQISLADNDLGTKGAIYIAKSLKSGNCPEGLVIDLWENEIDLEGARHISDALISGNCPERLKLYLGNNILGKKGISHMKKILEKAIIKKILPYGIQVDGVSDEIPKKLAAYNDYLRSNVEKNTSSFCHEPAELHEAFRQP